MTHAYSDVLLVGGRPNQWVKYVNNDGNAAHVYVSTAVTTFQSATTGAGVYTFNPSPIGGIYTSYLIDGSLSATAPAAGDVRWAPSGITSHVVSYTVGDDAALNSTTVSGSPNTQSPLAFGGGQVWGTSFVMAPPPSGDVTGVTDSAMIATLVAGGHIIVLLQPGTYWLHVALMDETLLVGAGRAATALKAPNGRNGNIIVNADTVNGNSRIGLKGMRLDGNKANQVADYASPINDLTSTAIYNLEFHKVSNWVLEDVETFNSIGDGLFISGDSTVVLGGQLTDVYTHDNALDGGQIAAGMREVQYSNVRGDANGRYGFHPDHSQSNVNGLHCDRNGFDGIFIRNQFAVNHTNLSADLNGRHGINVLGLVGSISSAWSAHNNGQNPVRTVADGVLNSTTTATSATAAFTAGDRYSPIVGAGIPNGTYIATVVNATTVVLSQAATATASGVSLTVGAGFDVWFQDDNGFSYGKSDKSIVSGISCGAESGAVAWPSPYTTAVTEVWALVVDQGITGDLKLIGVQQGNGGKSGDLALPAVGAGNLVVMDTPSSANLRILRGGIVLFGGNLRHAFAPTTEAVLVSGLNAAAGSLNAVTLTAARLVGAPLNLASGQRVTLQITQGGAGGFALTFAAIWKVTWSDAGNAAGKVSSISAIYNGTNLIQDGAQTPYV